MEEPVIQSTLLRLSAAALVATVATAACSSSTSSPASSATPAGSTGATATAGAATGPVVPTGSITLQGAGATFPATLYTQWFQDFSTKYSNIQIDYTANGSGAGIKAITQGTVDFGASDAPMKDSEIAALPAGTKLLHVPTALGAVVLIYNVPGLSSLQLDSQNVADIYSGAITKWNDAKIAANNPGVTLPDAAIAAVHRADSSGTTNAFTTYLDKMNADWHTNVGAGKDVKWPGGTGAQGNDGVAASVKNTSGAIGYVELSYAAKANLKSAKLKNADGNYVAGSTEGVTAAAGAAVSTFPSDFRQAPIINGAGADTYPIASYTYVLVYQDQANADKGKALVSFLYWALTDGQGEEEQLGYAPLPTAIRDKAIAELHQVTTGGSAIWP
jgi:phosphate transport system substrate-binding protein